MKIIEPVIQVTSNRVLRYSYVKGRSRKLDNLYKITDEDRQKRFKGVMSKKSEKNLSRALDYWFWEMKGGVRASDSFEMNNLSTLSFVTLTLSSYQRSSDKEIKRNMLNHFLIILKRKYGVERYIWKQELQQNGNLHFHIIIGRYIHYKQICSTWNTIQEKYGYIDDFQAKHGHRNPNSTDIKAIYKKDATINYVKKYMTKTATERENTGRVWGCSDDLNNLPAIEFSPENRVMEMFNDVCKSKGSFYFKGDYWELCYGQVEEIIRTKYWSIFQDIISQVKSIRASGASGTQAGKAPPDVRLSPLLSP